MRVGEIVTERASKHKLVIFDIDDTLVYTQTKIHVMRDGRVTHSLNSHEFAHYELKPGEEFDFGDFRSAREFFHNSRPNIPMMSQLKRDINSGNRVVMVTAREDFDDRDLFLDTFRKFGIDIDRVHVYRAGNLSSGSTQERKKKIIQGLLDRDHYDMAIMYDDSKANLDTFASLHADHPNTRFYGWLVSLDGHAQEYVRTGGDRPVDEASYDGNIGAMEMMQFFRMADPKQIKLLQSLIAQGKKSAAWGLIQRVTGVTLKGQEFQPDSAP